MKNQEINEALLLDPDEPFLEHYRNWAARRDLAGHEIINDIRDEPPPRPESKSVEVIHASLKPPEEPNDPDEVKKILERKSKAVLWEQLLKAAPDDYVFPENMTKQEMIDLLAGGFIDGQHGNGSTE